MKKSDVLQVLKFGVVGVCNTALDYGLFYVFLSLAHLDKNAAQILATVLAMPFSLAVNFLGNRLWVFRASEEERKKA